MNKATNINTILESLKEHYDASTNSFSPAIQEEYIGTRGWLDKNYLCSKHGIIITTSNFRKAVKKVFETADFAVVPHESDVTPELFYQYYKFGKYPNVVAWIEDFKNMGKVLTREKLFDYIINSEQPINSIYFWSNGVRPIKQNKQCYKPSRLFS